MAIENYISQECRIAIKEGNKMAIEILINHYMPYMTYILEKYCDNMKDRQGIGEDILHDIIERIINITITFR